MLRVTAVVVLSAFFSVGFCSDLSQELDRVAESRREGRFSEALQLLQQLRESDPAGYRLNNLGYLEAVLLSEDGKKEQANSILADMLQGKFLLPDRLLLRLIENTSEAEFEQRIPYYEAFLANHANHTQWYSVAFDYAAQLTEAKRDAQASGWYEKLAEMPGVRKRTARLRLAQIALRSGAQPGTTSLPQTARVIDSLKVLLKEKTDDGVATEAALILHDIDKTRPLPESDLAARALALVHGKRPAVARVYLRRVIEGYPKSPEQDHYHYLRARCAELEPGTQGVSAYEAVYERFPSTRWGIYSLYRAGSLHLRSRRYPDAAAAFRKVARIRQDNPHFTAAVIDLSEALVYQGDRAAAAAIIEESLTKAGRSDKPRFQYHLARISIEQENWAKALLALTELKSLTTEQLPSGVTEEEVAYWRGVCLERTGATADAPEAYRQAANGQRNYFAYLSAARIPEQLRPALTRATRVFDGSQLVARPLFKDEREKTEYRKSSALLRVEELLFLRLFDEAYREMRLLKPETVGLSREDYLFHLANWAVRGGLNWESINTAEQLQRLVSGRETRSVFSTQLVDLLYPRHYWETIEMFSQRYSVDPILVLSIIRQESGFVPKAHSSASARGLVQMMPATGRELARRAGLRLSSLDRLYDPVVSIQLGCMYIKEMIERYGGQTEKALAAYNGGPGNADRWGRKVPGQDPAVFVSNIGFRETKHYVLRVMGNYEIYRALLEKTKTSSTKNTNTDTNKAKSE